MWRSAVDSLVNQAQPPSGVEGTGGITSRKLVCRFLCGSEGDHDQVPTGLVKKNQWVTQTYQRAEGRMALICRGRGFESLSRHKN
jgi:hypothetical protein